MSLYSDFFGAGGGGGLTPKFQEFTSSGNFTPSDELIAAGGLVEVFIVGGGQRGASSSAGGCGGEIHQDCITLTTTDSCTVNIGAGGASDGDPGSNSVFSGSMAGGSDITALGGDGGPSPSNLKTSGAGGYQIFSQSGPFGFVGGGYAYASRAASSAGPGFMGYGAGGRASYTGILEAKANSGQGSASGNTAGSGYCLIKWFE